MSLIEEVIALSRIDANDLPIETMTLAGFSLLDWLVCAAAGVDEPLSQKLRGFAQDEGGKREASIFGGDKAPARMAALVNGATSHALDYDDTHFGHVGHLSVGIYPAALAVGEETGATAIEVIAAFAAGSEAAIRIGMVLGAAHYNHGFHQTATAGAFGATLAAGRLYKLTPEQMRNAIGLCSTRASGLKSQFGTMGKPYNAGIAASNGVECAKLAALDFTSCEDGLMGPQGFVETHGFQFNEEDGFNPGFQDKFRFEDNQYKLHACCHGLHAMIEGLLGAKLAHDDRAGTGNDRAGLSDIRSLTIETNPRWLKVCDKKNPKTGLEVKFSYGWLAGMTLRGDRTGDNRIYTDELARDPQLSEFAKKTEVVGKPGLTDMQVSGRLVLNNGQIIEFFHDLAEPVATDVLEAKLRQKAEAVLGEEGIRIWSLLDALSQLSARDIAGIVASRQ